MDRERVTTVPPLRHGPHIPQREIHMISYSSNPVLNILRGIHADRDIAGRIIGQLDQIRFL